MMSMTSKLKTFLVLALAAFLFTLSLTGAASAQEVAYNGQFCVRSANGSGFRIDCPDSSYAILNSQGQITQAYDAKTGKTTTPSTSAQQDNQGGYALQLYNYAVGTTNGSCFFCDFMSFFMIGLADFSHAVYQYFIGAFQILVPALILIWIGYRVAKLMAFGGDDGRAFIYSIVGKLSLFSVIWMIAVGYSGTNTGDFLWQSTGPTYLKYAFELSNAVRDHALAGPSNPTAVAATPMNCANVKTVAQSANNATQYDFVEPALVLGCIVERTHFIGVATGAAVITTSYANTSGGTGWFATNLVASIPLIIFKVMLGAFLIVVFALSAIWLTFLILDVVARGLITAAFSPVIIAMYLFQPTRGFASAAIKAMAGAMVTAVSIGVVSTLAFTLVTNTVNVYQLTHQNYANEKTYAGHTMPDFSAKDMQNRVSVYGTFIKDVENWNGDASQPQIPIDFSVPWFWYLVFTGVATFALGKKIISMLEGMIGYQGASAMADNALKTVKTAAMGAVGAGMATGWLLNKGGRGATAAGAGATGLGLHLLGQSPGLAKGAGRLAMHSSGLGGIMNAVNGGVPGAALTKNGLNAIGKAGKLGAEVVGSADPGQTGPQ